ncbi:nitroreductase family protein [Rhodothermaceae bacterium RA]|nr:nitroreductase family protein [Rhodothermaceae bacterium RA]
MSAQYTPIPLDYQARPVEEMQARADAFYDLMRTRRSVRAFSDRPVPRRLIERAIQTAGTAPSGAHRQPWRFVAVSDPALKHRIRLAAEAEERASYAHRMSDEWRAALAPLGTDWHKPFLEIAPWLVVCFAERYERAADGRTIKNYYVQESCGIACGLFIAAVHHMGLVTLTHTPSPMRFLNELLERPANEHPYILFPVGYPADGATVPALERKPLDAIAEWHEAPAEGAGAAGV